MDESVFFFGNSITNFTNGPAQSNVPYWMAQFAMAGGNTLEASGGFGFLRNFADREEPVADWALEGVTPIYNSDQTTFAQADISSVVISPANFLQEESPTADYFDEPRSPQEAVNDVVGDVIADQPNASIFIYEPWPDLGFVSNDFPPSEQAMANYHGLAVGSYHDWFVEFTANINAAYPGADVTLLPVAPVLSELLTSAPLDALSTEDFFVDSSPHGTETTYFLAAAIVYSGIYGEVPPANYNVPDTIHPVVAENFEQITLRIAELMETYSTFEVDMDPDVPDIPDQPDTPDDPELPVVDDDQTDDDGGDGDGGFSTDPIQISEPREITQTLDADPQSNTTARQLAPEEDIAPGTFTSAITIEATDTFTLSASSDDTAIIFMDDVPLLILTGDDQASIDLTLEPGLYKVQVKFPAGTPEPDVRFGATSGNDDAPLPLVEMGEMPEVEDDDADDVIL